MEIPHRYEDRSVYGSHFRPGTVLRCDGTESAHLDKPDLSATFVSFPYFDIGTGKPPNAPENESIHSPRGLFQDAYPQEAAHDRDSDQIFRKFKRIRTGDYLRVSQFWALILQSHTIITCGPASLPDMFDDSVEFVAANALLADGPSLIHVTDHLQRVAYLSLERCGTYLALRRSIEEECFKGLEETIDDFVIFIEDSDLELESRHWPAMLKSKTSAFVYLRLSRRPSRSELARRNSRSMITAPKAPALIEYTNLSSDDDLPGDESMALILRPPRSVPVTIIGGEFTLLLTYR
jgi:hypothetical protein